MSADGFHPSYETRVRKLFRRWDPRGLFVSDAKASIAVARLEAPPHLSTQRDLDEAQRVCDAAVHPVLKQPIPSAFRVCSFIPVTYGLSLGMISLAKLYSSTLVFHWLYQTHSAATRYCNYADTSRPLSVQRMGTAYAVSTAAACGLAVGMSALVHRMPSLRLLGMVVPHCAVASAGALSTVMNEEVALQEGVMVHDANGRECGVSRVAARETVKQAVMLHGLLVPGCALLLPVVASHALITPRLLAARAHRYVWPASAAVTALSCFVITPLAAALVSPAVTLPPGAPILEPEVEARRPDGGTLVSSRPLY